MLKVSPPRHPWRRRSRKTKVKLQPLDSPPPPPQLPEPSSVRGIGVLSDHGEAGQGDSTLAFLLTLPDSHLCLDSQPGPSNPTVCLSVHLCTCKPVCLCIHGCMHPCVYASVCLCICVHSVCVRLSTYVSVRLCICVSGCQCVSASVRQADWPRTRKGLPRKEGRVCIGASSRERVVHPPPQHRSHTTADSEESLTARTKVLCQPVACTPCQGPAGLRPSDLTPSCGQALGLGTSST